MLGGVGVGLFESYAQAVAGSVRHVRRHEPNAENAPVYAERYEIYRKLYPALKNM
jgi:xylulokinase